ncbi:hypothetical protein M3Y99_00813400 [Aphelenchoides fujianensis]|nr:hypothetical protein M3Y99_00813400 [Aphelenchoides fujianensis]
MDSRELDVCSKPMAFGVQIYGFQPSAFHRYLYVFLNEAANLKVLRSQLPLKNPVLFREYGLTIGTDFEPRSNGEDETEDEQKQADHGGHPSERILARIQNNEQAADGDGAEPLELLDEEEDRALNDFCRPAGRNQRPLSATDRSPLPLVETGHVPNCELDVPGAFVDRAAVFVFTCKNSCDLGGTPSTPEAGLHFRQAHQKDE